MCAMCVKSPLGFSAALVFSALPASRAARLLSGLSAVSPAFRSAAALRGTLSSLYPCDSEVCMRNALSVLFLACVACAVLPFPAPALAADAAGTVMVATPGAFVKRGSGEQAPVKVKDRVQVGDTLITDATGRLRVWMRDDTTISLGADSNFTLEAYDAAGARPQLKGAALGLVRLLTGKIAKANPEGTVVSTPLATVGVRGTICTIEARRDMTRVAVESCPTNVLVNGVPLVSGQMGVVRQAGGVPQIAPLTPTIRQELGGQIAARRLSAPGPTNVAGASVGKELPQVTNLLTNRVQEVAVERTLAQQRAEDMARLVTMASALSPTLPLNATVTANLIPVPMGYQDNGMTPGDYTFDAGSHLTFDVSLTSGNGSIKNAHLYGRGAPAFGIGFDFNLAGGSGQVQNGKFTIGAFQHTSAIWGGDPFNVTNYDVRGALSHNNTSVTGVNGDFRVKAENPTYSSIWYSVTGKFAKSP